MILSILFSLIACSDYQINKVVPEQEEITTAATPSTPDPVDEAGDDTVDLCEYNEDALFNTDRASTEQEAWTPGWNKVVEFTLTSDRDTCYADTFYFTFSATDYQETGWNGCDDAKERLQLVQLVDVDSNGFENWHEVESALTWFTYSEVDSSDRYIECDEGLELGGAWPYFNWLRTPIYANEPITFALFMEANGSTDPSDGMSIQLHSLETVYNNYNANGLYSGAYLFFEE
jgi:hypothetical protein